ncbi:MAG: homoserine O-succinyltransferase [Alphaproteobacteria bacterium]|nr:homoserine O-succinyltransferase [Alphaproteobacteria bacterium]
MPIKIPNSLPAVQTLKKERVPLILESRALKQDIRPLQIAILNLMPDKIKTETQLLRAMGASPLQIEITLLHTSTHQSKNTPEDHLSSFYATHDDVKDKRFDGLIVTGAPLGLVDYKDVTYWDELATIMDWSRRHVYGSFYICWGALAALYHFHGIEKTVLDSKKMGVFLCHARDVFDPLTMGFDDLFHTPIARHTAIARKDILHRPALDILAETEDGDPCLLQDTSLRHVYALSHLEYDAETLKNEYERNIAEGINPDLPENYFPGDNPAATPRMTWRAHRSLLFRNWVDTIYQGTPFNLDEIEPV